MELRRVCLLLAAVCACGKSPKGRTYYERNIEPILTQTCGGNTSGCHTPNADNPFAVVAGNFDVSTFESVQKRRDVLTSFGPYPAPLLLIKAVGPGKIMFSYNTEFRTIDVQHSGGGLIEVGSDAFFTLQNWLDNGATEDGLRPATPPVTGTGPCTADIPGTFDPTPFKAMNGFDTFKAQIQPIIDKKGCNASSCHGAPQSDFFLSCGTSDDQIAFNFSQAYSFLSDPVDDSQLLRVPISVTSGSRFHTGGGQFSSADDPDYIKLHQWATDTIAANGVRDFAGTDTGKQFFRDNVQPILIARGCQFQACHSPQATNDFKLRSGFPGFYSSIALERNYELLRDNFMALEYPDARRGRAVAKGILEKDPRTTTVGGITHRGGSVLDTMGIPADPLNPAVCTTPMASTFCTVQAWITLERTNNAANLTPMTNGTTVPIVYVDRTPAAFDRLDTTFHGGAELHVANATFSDDFGTMAPVNAGASTILSANCNLAGGDIRTPNVAPDGDRVVFAGRASAADRFGLYIVKISSGACSRLTAIDSPDANGLEVHNFDPAWSPDGSYVVYASTRGKAGVGPTKSRKTFKTQSDLWRVAINDTTPTGMPEQMTFLSNSEFAPAFMREGRVTMTTEKVSQGFYQLSGRRINWDLTDYHPLLAQRKDSRFNDPTMMDIDSTNPSIGYNSATDIREASDGDFMLILSDTNMDGSPGVASGAGALGLFNRSIGPFEDGRNDVGYEKSLRIIGDPGATGRAGTTTGYRRPFAMPDGGIMAAFTTSASSGAFDIHRVDPRSNASATIFDAGPGGRARMDAVIAYKHPPRILYANRRQLVFGGSADPNGGDAVLHMPDAPMVFTMLVANLRRGRPLDAFSKATKLVVYSEGMCPTSGCTANANGIFEQRMKLGEAKLAKDGSVKVILPSQTGLVFELQDDSGNSIVLMTEEHQFGAGERISMGVSRTLFDGICGGCHGSITGRETDIAVTPDALTGASASVSQDAVPAPVR